VNLGGNCSASSLARFARIWLQSRSASEKWLGSASVSIFFDRAESCAQSAEHRLRKENEQLKVERGAVVPQVSYALLTTSVEAPERKEGEAETCNTQRDPGTRKVKALEDDLAVPCGAVAALPPFRRASMVISSAWPTPLTAPKLTRSYRRMAEHGVAVGTVSLAVMLLAACHGGAGEGAKAPEEASARDDRVVVAPSASAASPTPPSCAPGGPGLSDCGATKEICCTSPLVTGGTFHRAINGTGSETAPATVSGFRLDKYDVTVGRFRQFVVAWKNGAGWTPPEGSGKHSHLNGGKGLANSGEDGGYEPGWGRSDNGNIAPTGTNLACAPSYPGEPVSSTGTPTWTPTAGTNENKPINCVNWYEAYAFCIWDGGFLPSQAEWEYAAVGGNQQREYPWGSTEPGTANQYAIYGGGRDNGYYPSPPAPVGTAASGAGPYGQLDLAGNVQQWNLDWEKLLLSSPQCTDCAYMLAGPDAFGRHPERVIRGGDFRTVPALPGGAVKFLPAFAMNPTDRERTSGFRCARTP
jgi:formylglycine-generating enzyme required for sulfatase activity